MSNLNVFCSVGVLSPEMSLSGLGLESNKHSGHTTRQSVVIDSVDTAEISIRKKGAESALMSRTDKPSGKGKVYYSQWKRR